ncbi:MAG: CBS domain-containing protein, partial [Planctomycetes bacterium]|nr:CBS domain-containing protein [Planctomycetota bacterium]
ISADAKLTDAIGILSQRKVSELPVIDECGRPIGLIDITDVIGEFPQETDIHPLTRSNPA